MTPRERMDDLALEDGAMRLRQWYHDAVPAPQRRQDAINRLLQAPGARREARGARLPQRRAWGWRRAGMVAAACAVAALALTWTLQERAPDDGRRLVAFEVRLPSREVREVALTGDFNGWDPHAMPMERQGSSDLWRIAIPLPPGRHVYSFVIDGTEWIIDPLAPRAELDELGPANVIAISGAGD